MQEEQKNDVISPAQEEGAEQSRDEELERIASEMDTPAKKFARWPQKKRSLFERAVGLFLGAAAGLCLSFIPAGESFLSLNIVIPIALALGVPGIIENQLQARLKELRKFMLFALGAYILVLAVLALTGNVPS